jgi:cephalosporin hydroxylase
MDFLEERELKARENFNNKEFVNSARKWHNDSRKFDYQYMFEVFGLPIIQDPQDIVMLQELIWKCKPQVILETGVARGGSLALSAAMLSLLDNFDKKKTLEHPQRKVIGVDINFSPENVEAITSHQFSSMIHLLQGSSIEEKIINAVKTLIPENSSVMVVLDSNHTHDHVLRELQIYSEFVTSGMPIVVMDTGIEFAEPETLNSNRPWAKGNNPYSATQAFLNSKSGALFKIDREIEMRHIITCAPEGILFKL